VQTLVILQVLTKSNTFIMKNQNLTNGKKLNKKELRSITGGLMQCIDPQTGLCRSYGRQCAESQCRFILEP
jgi:bacteriocin-like protein